MQCKVCNYELNENAIFCPRCGSSAKQQSDIICPNCGTIASTSDIFCNKCGSKIEQMEGVICKSCGNIIKSGSEFCTLCGHKIKEENDYKRGPFSISEISYYKSQWSISSGIITIMPDMITYNSNSILSAKHKLIFKYTDIVSVEIERVYVLYDGIVIKLYNGEKYGFFFYAIVKNRKEKLELLYNEIQKALNNQL